jgi:hypothetical protein
MVGDFNRTDNGSQNEDQPYEIPRWVIKVNRCLVWILVAFVVGVLILTAIFGKWSSPDEMKEDKTEETNNLIVS